VSKNTINKGKIICIKVSKGTINRTENLHKVSMDTINKGQVTHVYNKQKTDNLCKSIQGYNKQMADNLYKSIQGYNKQRNIPKTHPVWKFILAKYQLFLK
jgi:hypothetical protein